MNTLEFCQRLAEILDIEEVKPENTLKDFQQWDSLAVLSVLAMADSKYGVTIRADEIRSVVTAADLASLVDAKQQK
jgi:acyl carrier protein